MNKIEKNQVQNELNQGVAGLATETAKIDSIERKKERKKERERERERERWKFAKREPN